MTPDETEAMLAQREAALEDALHALEAAAKATLATLAAIRATYPAWRTDSLCNTAGWGDPTL